ncbi:MAG: Fe-S cluster assembly ATPase SufC [Acholeplasmatales bacterium]|jgi:Fe-S cluster assembly ATP-binding protein|nr:Fe-S cluster assembly ATPase SufC [Acholeplasmataceae bacterium]MCK9289058.1 Fe-S cluster assembly ATPase SufC [Acholeplasmataceae bacterium]MCK9427753.1 Fe-S cluster assembly ATPase SufC [Acholeplasmataceae bacterium]MDY0115538.1 Fe-S cluster assembly ATPase SufC [Acholeplasmatales bacterium]HHT39497.1 Fe-S cluster assembly ATPase SufC [Acholeplasmataceae bacterium]
MSTLIIKNLHVKAQDNMILNGVNLKVNSNEVHAIMGPNGTGKSTLASAIMGHPAYTITEGEVLLDGKDVLAMSVDERAKAGLFLGMQYPAEVSGVTNSEFVRAAIKSLTNKQMPIYDFILKYEKTIEELNMNVDLAHRYLNEGFSGGEKKRNEVLQMKMLKPKIAILDEIDSGLDIDALKVVGNNINEMISDDFGCILITHYQRVLHYIKPTFVHIMIDGKIVLTGKEELIEKIDKNGYQWLKEELGIEFKED